MTENRLRIDLEPLGGLAGDMFSAALIDAFPHLLATVRHEIARLGVSGLDVQTNHVLSAGMQARHFGVSQGDQQGPPRTPPEVDRFLRDSSLSDAVRSVASAIYRLLGEAEAQVHGKTLETIHFHEVSDWDSMADIVSAAAIISQLSGARWRMGPLPLGGGTVRTAHGQIAVPAPATLALLNGFEWVDDGVAGERVTPTGAAIIRYLSPTPLHAPAAAARLQSVGSGAGTRQLPDRANILRARVFSLDAEASASPGDECLTRLAFEVDDMTGEEIAVACDHLRQLDGVRDVSTVVMQGKKNRVATGFRVLVATAVAEQAMSACFVQTSTLGVRHEQTHRRVLPRSAHLVDGVGVKAAFRPGGLVTAKAESDGLAALPNLASRRRLAGQVELNATAQHADHNTRRSEPSESGDADHGR